MIKPFDKPILITQPFLPPLDEVHSKLKEIWESKWLTNMGFQHQELEKQLSNYFQIPFVSLFCNGTIALEIALKSLNVSGEIITTPFTFPATINTIINSNCKPVFCDINKSDFNINTDMIESLITPKTSAILPVHVFGNPCNVEKIEKIAKKHDLKVIYDSAHCVGVKINDKPVSNFGDINMFSFHATKIFHTIEGGALTYSDENLKSKIYLLKNFGIKDQENVISSGTNGKMNEIQAAIGLINLKYINNEILKKKKIYSIYLENLKDIDGISTPFLQKHIKYNYHYFPVLIDYIKFGLTRDEVYEEMHKFNIFPRKYFYPLATDYKYLQGVKFNQIPISEGISKRILCLPIYGDLKPQDVIKICKILLLLKNTK